VEKVAAKKIENTLLPLPGIELQGKKMKFILRLLILMLISPFLSIACATKQPPQAIPADLVEDRSGVVRIRPNGPVHIACWMVFQGVDAPLGIDTKRGVEIAVDEKRRRLLGHMIQITLYDTGCKEETGRAAAKKIAADPTIIAAIGPSCSSEARAGVSILWQAGIPTVSPSNLDPRLTDPNRGDGYDGYLRTSWNDKLQGTIAAEFAYNQLKFKKAATIHDGSPYAKYLQSVFVETFKNLGGTISAQEIVAPTDINMHPVLTKISEGQPDIIYFPIFLAAGSHITRQVRKISLLENAVLISADSLFTPDFYRSAKEAAIGMYHTCPDLSHFRAKYSEFAYRYHEKYKEKPIAPFHAHAYDAAMMIFTAIEKVAKKDPDGTLWIDRKALRDALYATREFKGLTGDLTCTQTGDCADPRIAIYQTTKENIRDLKVPERPYWKPY